MPQLQLSTNPRTWRPGWTTSPTSDTTLPTPTTTEPSADGSDGVVNTRNANLAKLTFYGLAEDGVCNVLVYGWAPTVGSNVLWIPSLIVEAQVTLGGTSGIIYTIVGTDKLSDVITFTNGDETTKITSGSSDTIASMTVDTEGATYLQVGLDFPTSGAASEFNFLAATL